jgi:hypothetical protein
LSVSGGTDALSTGDHLVESTGEAVTLRIEQLVILALADTERSLRDLSSRASTGVAVVDHAPRADSADAVHQETVGEIVTGSADLCGVIGEALLASTLSVNEDLIGLAGRAGIAVSSGSSSGGADLAGSIDSSQSLEAAATLSGSVVDLVGTAFSGTDTPLVGEESTKTVTVLGG